MDLGQAGLEPNPDAIRELIHRAAARVGQYLGALESLPACDTEGAAAIADLVKEGLPEKAGDYDALLDLLFERLLPKVCNTNSPGMFSYVNGGSLVHSAVADLITAASNPYVTYWGAAPGLAQLEQTVVDWLRELVGLPPGAGGVLLSGGSMGNLSALVAARRTRLGDDFARGTLYASDQVHHSVAKAVMFAGFPADALRIVPSDGGFRMDVTALESRIREDTASGRVPFCVVASAGTTSTGAIDDLVRVAACARAHGLWFHVDAAYGGCFALTERGRRALQGIEQADTVVLDPHKSLFIPFGTGCLLARDVENLKRTHAVHSSYLDDIVELGEDPSAVDFADLSPELSRGMRGLRIWLPMKLLGAEAFRRALDEKLDLARLACEALDDLPGFEIVARPELSIFAFRATEPGLSDAESDALNARVLERVNRRQKVHLSPTRLNGRFTLRMCVLSLRSHRQAVETCLRELRECR